MNAVTDAKNAEPSLPRIAFALLRHYLGGRRGLVLLTVAALATGLALNWSWLVAAGIAPLLLALAPCAAMCALGLCAHNSTNKSGAPQPMPDATTNDVSRAPDALPVAAASQRGDEPGS